MLYQLGEHKVVCEGEGHFIAPSACVIGRVTLKHQTSVWFNVVIRADSDDVVIGEGCNIQDGAVLHVDPGFPLKLEPNVTVGHQAMLHGCEVGEGSLIGINAVVLNGVRIGKNCIIGANALLTENMQIPDNSLVVGAPAAVKRQLDSDELGKRLAQHYKENAQRYREQLREQHDSL